MPYSEPKAQMDRFLVTRDCELDPAPKYPGKLHRKNEVGSSENKSTYIKSQAAVWVNHMKDHPKYEGTPLYQRCFCLKYHLRKLSVPSSECRKILVEIESTAIPNQEQNDAPETNMDTNEDVAVDDENQMDIEPPLGSQDMFADMDAEPENLSFEQKNKVIVEKLQHPIEDLLNSEDSLPQFVLESRRYREAKNSFIEKYLGTNFRDATIEELVNSLTPLPKYIRESSVFKKKINKLNDQQKSEKRLLKNINTTLSLLQENPTKTAIEERKVIASAAYDHFCGFPNINETKFIKQEAKSLKMKLLSGEANDLKPSEHTRSEFFPPSVKVCAEQCWRNHCTVVEPGKHSRPKSALKDGNEVIPAIYQTLTDSEAYAVFKDIYSDEVRDAMMEDCNQVRVKLETRNNSARKQKQLELLQKKETRFPSALVSETEAQGNQV